MAIYDQKKIVFLGLLQNMMPEFEPSEMDLFSFMNEKNQQVMMFLSNK